MALSLLVLVAYGVRTAALVAFPWDWAPDEGLFVDYARRLVASPALLYPTRVPPYPMIYTPLLALVLAPAVVFAEAPLPLARLLVGSCAGLGALAIARLVARRSGWPAGAAAAALALAPFDLTFWHVLVRVDGPMNAAWLLSALWLLPERLARGADRLDRRRLLVGAAWLLAAVGFKPTAAVLALPVLAGWFVVDRASAWRLNALVLLVGLACVVVLQVATGGGFLWSLGLYRHHPRFPSQVWILLRAFLQSAWPLLLVAGVAFAWAATRRRQPWRDGAVLLLLGSALVTPMMAKAGASWSYLLPLLGATAIAAGRWAGSSLLHLAFAAVALALAASRPFPLPSPGDYATARFFYGYVEAAASRGPLFAARPDYAYYVAGQPVRVGTNDIMPLLVARTPGVAEVLAGLAARRHALVILGPWGLPPSRLVEEGLAGYTPVGECLLGSYLGSLRYRLLLRPDLDVPFDPPRDVDCRRATPVPPG